MVKVRSIPAEMHLKKKGGTRRQDTPTSKLSAFSLKAVRQIQARLTHFFQQTDLKHTCPGPESCCPCANHSHAKHGAQTLSQHFHDTILHLVDRGSFNTNVQLQRTAACPQVWRCLHGERVNNRTLSGIQRWSPGVRWLSQTKAGWLRTATCGQFLCEALLLHWNKKKSC